MSYLANEPAEGGAAEKRRWPDCEYLEAQCLAYSLAKRLGTRPLARLVAFVAEAGTGARLTLQRNRTEFTVQVTDAVEKAEKNRLDPVTFRQLGALLSSDEEVKE